MNGNWNSSANVCQLSDMHICMQAEGYDVIYFIQNKYLKMDLFKVMKNVVTFKT